ncbi:hypothetical protein Vretimale_13318 [Volvox reticuliferus]|uniref:Protein kinase domain-containing protein n=1 Tax=Volvox reticuliferus TaxID=1737510 RepID=A0A8J4CS20_9CHLO|nr:hypothetical protein Vretifemale_14071 [Volvox reticuliferus]GIM09468.1 hypothetical protein Vretimale_13318 [Volvox reticuliferus]
MHVFEACFGFCLCASPVEVRQLDAPPVTRASSLAGDECGTKLSEEDTKILQDVIPLPPSFPPVANGTAVELRQVEDEENGFEQKMTVTVMDTPFIGPAPQPASLCSLRPEVRPELASLLISAKSLSKISFHSPSLQLSALESTASLGSGTIALISDVRVSIGGERQASDCGPIAVKLSTLEQLLASVTEPLWVGQGAQGAVLKAQWRSGDCTVAVKWLVSDGGDLPAAYMEALLAKILAHPFLVQTFEYGMCKLDGSFDQLLQQYQQQQQQQARQEEKQQRQHEAQQPPETLPQATNQPLYQYALDCMGKPLCHGEQEEPAQEQQQVQQQQQQQQNPKEGQSEAGGGDSSPGPLPYLPSPIVLNPVQHPARSASAAGAISPSSCYGVRGECCICAVSCSGSNTNGSVPVAEYPTTQSRETAQAPTAEELGASPRGLSTQRTWVGAAPSPFEVLAACRDSFDGSGTAIGLRSVDCVGVLKQLGAARGKYVVQIVSEWCDEGTLYAAIRRGVFKAQPPGPGVPGRSRTWALRALLRTAREVAMGMCHLHSLGIIHGDLKPGNVLLKSSRVDSRGFVAKVADFGLSRLCNQREEFVTTANWGTVPYMAGEYLDNRLYKSSDVYSFGVLLWQMYTGKAPFAEHMEAQVAVGVMMGNLQLEWPTNMPPPLLQLGQACCRHEPDQRPTFKEVVVTLMGIEAQVRDAHARAKMAIRRIDANVSSVSRPVHGSSGGLTLPLAHAMSHPQPHGPSSGALGDAAAAATLTGPPARHPLYPSQPLHQSHHHHQIQPNHFHYQFQHQPVAMQLQHHLLLQQQQKQCVAHPVVTCGSSNTIPTCDSGPGAPPSPFVSNVGADVMGVVSTTAPAAIPSQPTMQVLPQASTLAAAAPPQPTPFLLPHQQPPPALLAQTSQLPPNLPSGRFVPTSTSRLHIRTSFADIPQASPAGGECADYGFDVSSVAQDTNSLPPTLSDTLSVHTAMAPPKLPAATGVVTIPSFTCSSVTESPPVPFALSPMSPAGGLAWAACFSPTAVPGNERNSSLVSPTAAEISPIHARSLGPTIVAHDAAPPEAARQSVDFPVDGTKMPVVEFTSVFGDALDSLGSSALLGSTTRARLPQAGSALAVALETCPPQQQLQQQPPVPGGPLALVQPMACGLPCRPPQTNSSPVAICGCASTESSEPCARATVHGISVAAAAAPQLQLLPDIQQHASLPVPLPNADGNGGNGVHQGTPTSLSAFMAVPRGNCYSANVPRLEEHPPQVLHQPRAQQGGQSAYCSSLTPPAYAVGAAAGGNGDSGGVGAGWMTSSCISSAGLHGLVQQQQQQQPQSAGIPRGVLRGGRVVASTLCGVSGASLPAASGVLHRRPRCAFGLASGAGAAASRRGSGAGPMPHLHGFNAGFPAAGPLLDDLPSPGLASMMLIPLAPLHESVEGPGMGAEA